MYKKWGGGGGGLVLRFLIAGHINIDCRVSRQDTVAEVMESETLMTDTLVI